MPPVPPGTGNVEFSIRIPAETHLWLKHRAVDEYSSVNTLINRYLAEGRARDELADAGQQASP